MSFSVNAATIHELEAEVNGIENIIRDLRDKQISLRTQCNSNLPFFCLPLELCIAIFSLACHKGRLPERQDSEKIPLVTTPFVISAVCHGWRVMAHSVPKLWCSVSLCVWPYVKDHSEIQAKLLDQWLQLAQALPLSIIMAFDRDELEVAEASSGDDEASDNDESFNSQSEECLAAVAAVTSVVTSRSHQWESLDLFLPFYWTKIFASGMGHCPNLKSLDLCTDTEGVDSWSRSRPPFSTTFRDAPKLRTVMIDDENVELLLHQLEELGFWGYVPSEAFFSQCTDLKIYRQQSLFIAPDTSRSFVHLSKLVSLEISSSQPKHLLGCLVTPSLVSITLSLGGSVKVEAFKAFLTHSGVALKHLSIINYVPPEEELMWKLFNALPNLSHLEIDIQSNLWTSSPHHWPQRFFNYFSTPNTTSGSLPLPHLTNFTYRGRLEFLELQTIMKPRNVGSGNSVEVDTLEKVLLARWNAGLHSDAGAERLQEFSLFITDLPKLVTEMEQSVIVKELRKEGMHLAFKLVD
ncbi:uncharacterized protein LACBIDRAFT_329257 [Laccaria bicolor S238N-H82]|uniref:Predicted protein n=1 Tax=Laccaria bicolor (strain S238N-H82 / ATCC MYA-4686) TaxID=486041 RepID=B0DHI5_LACBS|nr:uncharacterized protein LACBIDRAFT_329257 [Laccaria bicolor S238N-H82]EDR06026.1 predicted protein [Laccaria bicolor S238N-H82]|eukprot:XP_001883314.1 predicted protein [Laccaria bicolor S238N-H82]